MLPLSLDLSIWNLKARPPMTHFLRWSHAYSNKASSPNSASPFGPTGADFFVVVCLFFIQITTVPAQKILRAWKKWRLPVFLLHPRAKVKNACKTIQILIAQHSKDHNGCDCQITRYVKQPLTEREYHWSFNTTLTEMLALVSDKDIKVVTWIIPSAEKRISSDTEHVEKAQTELQGWKYVRGKYIT